MQTFLRWFCIALTYAVMLFFGVYTGAIQSIWQTDVTYMTSIIGAIFALTTVYLGYASWLWDQTDPRVRLKPAVAHTNLGRTSAYLVTLIGLLGTAIGLMFQVRAIGHLDVSQVQNISAFISSIGSSLGTALYSTTTGIIASIGISVVTANLEYEIDLKD